MRLRFSRLAEADIIGIGDFIAQESPDRAVRFVAGLRVAVFGNYRILHVVHPGFVEIRRVVHGARDIGLLAAPD